MIGWAVLAVALAAFPAAGADWPLVQHRGVSTPSDFRAWAVNELDELRDGLEDVDRRAHFFGVETRDDFAPDVAKLKDQVQRIERLLAEAGDRGDREAWRARGDIRDDIRSARRDISRLHRQLDRM